MYLPPRKCVIKKTHKLVFSDQLEKQWCVIKLDLAQFFDPRRNNFAIEGLNVSYSLASFWIFYSSFILKSAIVNFLHSFSLFFSRNMKNPLTNVRVIWPSSLKIHYQAGSFGLWTIKLFVSNLFGHLFEMQSNLRQILIFSSGEGKKSSLENDVCLKNMRAVEVNVKRQKIKFLCPGVFNHSD